MQIRVYTEQAWDSYPKLISCFGIDRSPIRILPEMVKGILERAALPGNEHEEYIVVSEDTIRKAIEENKRVAATSGTTYRGPIFTFADKLQ